MLSDFKFLLLVIILNIVLEVKIAVNILVKIPQHKTIAKPLIGPEPNWYKISAAKIVVTLASTIVVIALEKPLSTADFDFLPFSNSSLILSKIITLASTAIPTVKIKPAIPGNVKVASNMDNIDKTNIRLKIKPVDAMKPDPR